MSFDRGNLREKLAQIFLSALVCLLATVAYAVEPPPPCAKEILTLRRADGASFPFEVELARTPQQQEYGLMNRQSLPPQSGMLFVFSKESEQFFWMKNTYITLDLLFIRANGTIARITARAKPLDTTPLPSGEPVKAVLELNGGVATRLGLKPGDQVLDSYFTQP